MSTLYWNTTLGNIYGFTSRKGTYTDIEDKKKADIFFEKVRILRLCSIIPILILIFVLLIL